LNRLEQKLVRDSGLKGCFVVQLIVDKELNAYSLPGGFLYLTTGLALSAETEGELVAALAHETAHVMARHFSRIERKRRMGLGLMLAGGPAGYLVAQFLGPILMRKQVRNAEFEADRLCFQYQYMSGHDPGEFTRLLRNIAHRNIESSSFVSRLFDTHPSIASRIRRLDNVGEGLPPGHAKDRPDDGAFRDFQALLLSHYTSP